MSHSKLMQWSERIYHRDQLRSGRYAALADSEGFLGICFALEALGLRLLGVQADLGKYKDSLRALSRDSVVLTDISRSNPDKFSRFDSLYDLIRRARNDAMHTGVYARHATAAAIELCIGLEEALMKQTQHPRNVVADFMVKSPVIVERWQPIAHARQLMLTHSFSYLPVKLECWMLISEGAMARYIQNSTGWKKILASSIEEASANGLKLIQAKVVSLDENVSELLRGSDDTVSPSLWLVQDAHDGLCGVLSPFELM
ncbi:hypothetical protein [Pseudomonas capeferrum]